MPTYVGSATKTLRHHGGELYVSQPVDIYTQDTTSRATVYADRTGTTVGHNPAYTDKHGRITFYAAAGYYDLSYDSGAHLVEDVAVHPDPVETAASIDDPAVPVALTGALTGTDVLTTDVTADTQKRLIVDADGTHTWGSGSATGDTNLYRSAANVLKTDDTLISAVGVQATATAVTATADGLTTGLIPANAGHVTVTSGNADHIVTLPTAVAGMRIAVHVGANGCEVRTAAGTNATINGVDSDGTNEAALAASSLAVFTAVSATAWIAGYWVSNGTPTQLVPDTA